MRSKRLGVAFEAAPAGAAPVAANFPGLQIEAPHETHGRAVAGGVSAAVHFGGLALLFLLASLAPVIEEELIPVQLLRDELPRDEPAPARKALAERRALDYAPAVQAVQPQIVNPRVLSDASPAVSAEALQMDAVDAVAAPTQIARARTVVERVSAVRSSVAARASPVDVGVVGGPVVRGPIRAQGPVGPSVGPRKVEGASGNTFGTGTLAIGGGSSVREGVASSRDVLGSPDGSPLVSVDTRIGEGLVGRGSGGTGTGGGTTQSACYGRPAVRSYLAGVESRTINRWVLPPGLPADQRVTLRFHLDVAGSASRVNLVTATDNALGASAVDALRAASPFPPMPESARCLAQTPITATFSNPGAS